MQIIRIMDTLPADFEALRAEAEAQGHGHLTRLAAEWAADPQQFTTVLAAIGDGAVAGIGALTPEPCATPEPAWRMRRLFVSRSQRRQGVGRSIANALLQEALDEVGLVTVHAGSGEAAAFWTALGFRPVRDVAWSHQYSRAAC